MSSSSSERHSPQRRTSSRDGLTILTKPEGDGAAVIVTHPGAITADCYQVVADQLEGYGFGVLELDHVPEYRQAMLGGQALDLTIDELSRRFSDSAIRFLGGRPAVLLGWSFGGVLAYGLAQELSKRATINHLVLLDSIAPGPGDPGKRFGNTLPDREALDWFAMYFGAKRGTPLGFEPSDFVDDDLDTGLVKILQRCHLFGSVTADTSVAGLKKVLTAFVDGILRNKRLHDGFDPQPPQWPVSLIRPERGLFESASALGWTEVIDETVPLHRCAGDHYTMLTERGPAEILGKTIASVLRTPTPPNQRSS